MTKKADVLVTVESEKMILDQPATVRVYINGVLHAEVLGKIETQQGLDGKFYPAVMLERKS